MSLSSLQDVSTPSPIHPYDELQTSIWKTNVKNVDRDAQVVLLLENHKNDLHRRFHGMILNLLGQPNDRIVLEDSRLAKENELIKSQITYFTDFKDKKMSVEGWDAPLAVMQSKQLRRSHKKVRKAIKIFKATLQIENKSSILSAHKILVSTANEKATTKPSFISERELESFFEENVTNIRAFERKKMELIDAVKRSLDQSKLKLYQESFLMRQHSLIDTIKGFVKQGRRLDSRRIFVILGPFHVRWEKDDFFKKRHVEKLLNYLGGNTQFAILDPGNVPFISEDVIRDAQRLNKARDVVNATSTLLTAAASHVAQKISNFVFTLFFLNFLSKLICSVLRFVTLFDLGNPSHVSEIARLARRKKMKESECHLST